MITRPIKTPLGKNGKNKEVAFSERNTILLEEMMLEVRGREGQRVEAGRGMNVFWLRAERMSL